MLQLEYLPVNAAWTFTFGDAILQVGSFPRFFTTREAAVAAANNQGLTVAEDGTVLTGAES